MGSGAYVSQPGHQPPRELVETVQSGEKLGKINKQTFTAQTVPHRTVKQTARSTDWRAMSVTMHKWLAKKGGRGGGGLIQGSSADTISAGAGVIEAGSSPALELNVPNRPSHNGRKLGADTVTTVPVCKINEGNEGAGTIPGPLVPRSSGDRVAWTRLSPLPKVGTAQLKGWTEPKVGSGL